MTLTWGMVHCFHWNQEIVVLSIEGYIKWIYITIMPLCYYIWHYIQYQLSVWMAKVNDIISHTIWLIQTSWIWHLKSLFVIPFSSLINRNLCISCLWKFLSIKRSRNYFLFFTGNIRSAMLWKGFLMPCWNLFIYG